VKRILIPMFPFRVLLNSKLRSVGLEQAEQRVYWRQLQQRMQKAIIGLTRCAGAGVPTMDGRPTTTLECEVCTT